MIDTRTTKNAVYIIDDDMIRTHNHPVPSGWDYDLRGALNPVQHQFGRTFTIATDSEHNEPVSLKRNFLPLRGGKANFVLRLGLKSGNGLYFNFYDVDGNVALSFKQKGHTLVCGDKTIPAPFLGGTRFIAIEFDIDEKIAKFSLDGRELGWYTLLSDSLATFKIGYEKDAVGEFVLEKIAMWINYLVCDRNLDFRTGDMPEDWIVYAEGNANAYSAYYYEGSGEVTYALHAEGGSTVTAYHPFEETSGKVCFDLKFLSKGEGDNVIFSLTKGEDDVVSVVDTGLYSQSLGGTLLRKHSPYVWQFLRFEADTSTKKALIKHNGAKCGEIDFDMDADSFDGLSITFAPEKDGYMRFTDVYCYEIQPEPADYPKAPVRPEKDENYSLGINVCSLWRNGEHWGWDAISSFEANKTYLGYYDEPLTEVADWEIKWMVEHGIDAQFYCWFENQTQAPIFKTHICGALDDGYFNAKYCDEMNFALIWEAANASAPDMEGFKKYLVPYWIDHYFTHPNYYRVDNYAVLAIFGLPKAIRNIGGPKCFKEAMSYLEGILKDLGYSGLITLTSGEPSDEVYEAGITAVYAYNWGHQSYSYEYTKARINAQRSQDRTHVVPTACVGYNDVAWREFRSPFAEADEFGKMLSWFKSDVLPEYEGMESWKKKFAMLATWNEYGEGTIMCPSNINGFGYLNEVRRAFTKNGDDFESDRPTAEGLDRLGYLYPRPRAIIQAPQLERVDASTDEVLFRLGFDTQEDLDKWSFAVDGEGFVEIRDGKLYGESRGEDPKLVIPLDFDAKDVGTIKFKIRAFNGNGDINNASVKSASLYCHYITDEDGEWHYNKQLEPREFDGDYAVLWPFRDVKWTGRIKAFRFDPCNNDGKFEVEEILFMKRKVLNETYIDGTFYNSHYASRIEDGEVYVPFEPLRDFCALTRIYHEWDAETRTVMMEKGDIKSYWTEGSDIVKLSDGSEVKLKKPLESYDNLPMIELTSLAKIMGFSAKVDGNRIDIMTK